MDTGSPESRAVELARRFLAVRSLTVRQCAPLAVEDYVVQSMPDASPVKWHLAHTTWFFESFVLAPFEAEFRAYDERWAKLHNSYYEAFGERHPRPARGLLTRPTVDEVLAYRAAIDERITSLLRRPGADGTRCLDLVELGIHHEQQHQELVWTDLQHALFQNPLRPALVPFPSAPPDPTSAPVASWIEHAGGVRTIGHDEDRFAFDNEGPAHREFLEPFALSSALVTSGEFTEFIDDRGYERPEHWLSDGFSKARDDGWRAPLYWEKRGRQWWRYSLHGMVPVDPLAPVAHVSFYEADAYARWHRARLPTEAEWETVARASAIDGQFIETGWLLPARTRTTSLFGGVWAWTSSPYDAYPGFVPERGAVGEYNGKFMVNQMVLRGGSCFSSRSHLRATYRNFFPPHARWQASGIRLARRESA